MGSPARGRNNYSFNYMNVHIQFSLPLSPPYLRGLPHSLSSCSFLSSSLPRPSAPLSLLPSLPPPFRPSLPPSTPPSLHTSTPPSLSPPLRPSISSSLHPPSLPPSTPPLLPPSLHPFLPPPLPLCVCTCVCHLFNLSQFYKMDKLETVHCIVCGYLPTHTTQSYTQTPSPQVNSVTFIPSVSCRRSANTLPSLFSILRKVMFFS